MIKATTYQNADAFAHQQNTLMGACASVTAWPNLITQGSVLCGFDAYERRTLG